VALDCRRIATRDIVPLHEGLEAADFRAQVQVTP
jgi:hypothetical protein